MRFFKRLNRTSQNIRGTTMLYLTGAVAVLLILCFGLASQSVRETQHVLSIYDRTRAEWLLRGAMVQAKSEAPMAKELRLASGIIRVQPSPAEDPTPSVQIEVLVPPTNARYSAIAQLPSIDR